MRSIIEGVRLINDKFDWNLIRTFLVIASEQSIHKAAARLHVTQPAVSQALKRLEERLGEKLINRSGHRFSLTHAGQEIYRLASEMNFSAGKIMESAKTKAEEISGTIRLLLISRIESDTFDKFMSDFHARHPLIILEIDVMRSSDIIGALRQKSATAGICLVRAPVPKIETITFTQHRYSFFCGLRHPFYGDKDVTLEDLSREDLVTFSSEQSGGSLSPLVAFRESHGFSGKVTAVSPNLDELIRCVYQGFGIGCLPEHIVSNSRYSNRLWKLPLEEGALDVDIYFTYNRDQHHTPAESVFIREMTEYLQNQPIDQS